MKLTIPAYAVKNIRMNESSSIVRHCNAIGDNLVYDKLISQNLAHGIKQIEYDLLRNEITLNLSAKILKSDYMQGISNNTIERVIDEINNSNIVELNIESTLCNGVIRRVDVVNNVEVNDIKESVLAVYNGGLMNPKYAMRNYTSDSLGYQAVRKVKSYKERQIGYSKLKEIEKRGLKFAKVYPEILKKIGPNTLRVETNLVSFAKMRKELGISSTNLQNILNSKHRVNSNIFERIVSKSNNDILLAKDSKELGFTEIRNMIGYEGIFKRFNNDLSVVEDWIKSTYPRGKHSYYIKLLRNAYSILNDMKNNQSNYRIEELSHLLKSA